MTGKRAGEGATFSRSFLPLQRIRVNLCGESSGDSAFFAVEIPAERERPAAGGSDSRPPAAFAPCYATGEAAHADPLDRPHRNAAREPPSGPEKELQAQAGSAGAGKDLFHASPVYGLPQIQGLCAAPCAAQFLHCAWNSGRTVETQLPTQWKHAPSPLFTPLLAYPLFYPLRIR